MKKYQLFYEKVKTNVFQNPLLNLNILSNTMDFGKILSTIKVYSRFAIL